MGAHQYAVCLPFAVYGTGGAALFAMKLPLLLFTYEADGAATARQFDIKITINGTTTSIFKIRRRQLVAAHDTQMLIFPAPIYPDKGTNVTIEADGATAAFFSTTFVYYRLEE